MMFERILVPLDGSPRAETILPQLARVLRRDDAEVLLVRSVKTVAERSAAHEYLHDVLRRFSGRGARVNARVLAGAPAESVLRAAAEEHSTLIAMATHGRTGLARFAFGSVAEQVLRESRVPLLLVRSFRFFEPTPASALPFRKILVPIDGKPSAAALRPAVKFAQLFNARGVFLHVVDERLPGQDPVTLAAAKRFEAVDLKATRRTIVGDPASAILDQAVAQGVDLIAMATHGRQGLTRWVLGSVAERVLRASPVPMLVLRG